MACSRNTPEFDALKEKFGQHLADKALRYAKERNMDSLPTPEEFLPVLNDQGYALELSDKQVVTDTYDGFGQYVAGRPDYHVMAESVVNKEVFKDLSSRSAIIEIAEALQRNLGIQYRMVTAEEAAAITANLAPENQYRNGKPGFFLGDTVYLVNDFVTAKTVFHEFCHPIVRALAKENKSLFDKLYAEISATNPQIIEDVKASHPSLAEGTEYFAEEVIVKTLTDIANLKSLQQNISPNLSSIVQKILYAIKQALRKIFGKRIDISSLSESTSILDLARMLEANNQFTFNKELVTDDSFAAYAADHDKFINDLITLRNEGKLQTSISSLYDRVQSILKKMKNDREFREALSELKNEYERKDINEIRSLLKDYQNGIDQAMQDATYERAQMLAFINSIEQLDVMVKRINDQLREISKDVNNKDSLKTAFYLNSLLSTMESLIKEYEKTFTKAGIDSDSPLYELITKIRSRMVQSKVHTNSIYTDGVSEILYDTLIPLKEAIDAKYSAAIDYLTRKGAPEQVIKARTREWEELKLSPEKIESLLKGELGDAHALNSFLEGYMNNQDPVIFGFSLYVKNNFIDMQTKAQRRANEYATALKPFLDAAGFNPTNIGDLGRRVTFRDTVGGRENNEFKERQVYTYANPWMNYKKDIDQKNYEIEKAKEEAAKSGDYSVVRQLIQDKLKWERKYFHTEYTDKYYERQFLLEKDAIGVEAGERLTAINTKIRDIERIISKDEDNQDLLDELKEYKREKKELSSLIDSNGNKKTGKEKEIALRLQEYNAKTKDMYDEIPLNGVFQSAYKKFVQQLIDNNIKPGTNLYDSKVDEWLKNNTRVRIKPEYYTRRAAIMAELVTLKERQKEILLRLAVDISNDKLLDLYDKRNLLLGRYKDKDNQTSGLEMPEDVLAEIKKLDEQILEEKEKSITRTGLTKIEQKEYQELVTQRIKYRRGDTTAKLTIDEQDRLEELEKLVLNRRNKSLDPLDKALLVEETKINEEILTKYAELDELQKTEPTSDYLDIMNSFYNYFGDDIQQAFQALNIREFDATNIDDIILENTAFVDMMRANSKEFREWFDANHILKDVYSKQFRLSSPRYVRTSAWNITRPADSNMYESTVITEPDGSKRTIPGIPTSKYFTYQVKRDPAAGYMTEKVSIRQAIAMGDITKANWDGYNWLPKLDVRNDDGTPDTTYVNNEFFKLKNSDVNTYNLLMKLIDLHLELQEDKAPEERLGLEIPRFRMSNLEAVQNKNFVDEAGNLVKQNPISTFSQKVKEFFQRTADDQERGFNAQERIEYAKLDMFDDQVNKIPIQGKYYLSLDDTSLDVLTGTMRYMFSLERNAKLREMSPVARTLQNLVNDPEQLDIINQYQKKNMINRAIEKPLNKKGLSTRAQAINAFIEREFEGKYNTGIFSESKLANSIATSMLKTSALGFFAVNIESAVRNSLSARIQSVIEGAAGRFYSNRDYAKGTIWSNKTMAEISFQIYKYGPKSLDVQLTEIFDPTSGRFEEKLGENLTRTFAKDLLEPANLLTNTRKWTELNANLSLFGAMMHAQLVEITIDGEKKMIPYIEAWELKDGNIQLREGIDPEWGIGGSKFKMYRNKIQAVSNNVNGAFGKFDYSQADRFFFYRQIMFLKRFFLRMLLNRFQFRGNLLDPKARYDVGLNDSYLGYYIEAIRALKEGIATGGKSFSSLLPEQKQAFAKVIMEAGILVGMSLMIALLFGFDADDEDKYEKLRKKSGALPLNMGIFETVEDPEHPFKLGGYMSNSMLALMLKTRQEQMNWIPLPGVGLNNYIEMLTFKSLAVTQTAGNLVKLLGQLVDLAQGDDKAYYVRDVGPYSFQKEGSPKFLNTGFKFFGITGTQTDPILATKNFISIRNMQGGG